MRKPLMGLRVTQKNPGKPQNGNQESFCIYKVKKKCNLFFIIII